MPVPQALVTRFFQLLVNRQFTEAERELERVKQKMHKTEWNRGYFRALYGMFLSRKANGDVATFLAKLDLNDKATLHAYRREFLSHVGNKIHADFDHGYFSAWADCMRVLSRMEIPSNLAVNSAQADTNKLETAESDGHQATIESFMKEDEN
ncbi:MAG: hypothetical protein QHH24_06975 [Candidatus Bathyarchaeota archaeon]|jgi:hypothetical protein|nr:hypothetical protein [Candidatus Bathyarchaeota archaeon]